MKKFILAALAVAGLTLSSGAALAQSSGSPNDLSFNGVDADGNGVVTWAELQMAYPDLKQADFDMADLNRDGMLEVAEYDSLITATGSIAPLRSGATPESLTDTDSLGD
jgi:hypothetical protein